MRKDGWAACAAAANLVLAGVGTMPVAHSAPAYDLSRQELEAVLADLIAWLPGGWDSYPQIHFERRYRTPAEGEHVHWHHIFERIDAPQIGEVVFYGQINEGGRDAPLLHRSQIIYKVWIDEERGAVVINGQGPADPEKYVDLHERPELWSKVQMRDPAAINCDFLWRRDGEQIFGVLDAKVESGRSEGPGTCAYMVKGTDVKFVADAEWVLGPDVFWDYDINLMSGHQFVGRKDRTHIRMYRSRGYECTVTDASGARTWHAHDRGAKLAVKASDGRELQLLLLRAHLPDAAGKGMFDKLHLMLQASGDESPLHDVERAPRGPVELNALGVGARCAPIDALPPMHKKAASAGAR